MWPDVTCPPGHQMTSWHRRPVTTSHHHWPGCQLLPGKTNWEPSSQTSSITIGLILVWPGAIESHLWSERDLTLGWYWASLAAWSLVISVIIRCYGVCRVSDHTLTPPEPHISGVYWRVVSLNVYSMLIAFVLKLRLENCIQIQFASNLHQIMDLLGWFLATIEFQIWLCLILRYHYHFQTHQIEIPSTNWPAL